MIDFEKEEAKLNRALAMPPNPIRPYSVLAPLSPSPSKEGEFINELKISFAKCELEEIDRLYSLACGIALRYQFYDLQNTITELRDEAKKRYAPVWLDTQNAKGYTTSERRPDGYLKEKYHRFQVPDKTLSTQPPMYPANTIKKTENVHISLFDKYWRKLEQSPILSNATGGIITAALLAIAAIIGGAVWAFFLLFKSF